MMILCKNCSHVFEGKFCNNCGQPSDTHKLNFHFLWHDIQHGLFHFDYGVYYSLKELYTRPGHSIREFINGKRVRHFKPVSLVIILASLYGLLYHSFPINLFVGNKDSEQLYHVLNEWISTHYSWLTLATIPLYTLGTYICFRNRGYNYMEYLVLNCFKASQRLFFHIAAFPLLYHFAGSGYTKSAITLLYTIDIILIYWTNLQFFAPLSKLKILFLTLLSHMIFLAAFFVILIIIVLMLGLAQ